MAYEEALNALTVKDLLRAVGPHLSRGEKRNREEIVFVIGQSRWMQDEVVRVYEEKKERFKEERQERLKRCRMDARIATSSSTEDFAQNVGDHRRDEVLSSFLERTGNYALTQAICVICAGEFFRSETMFCKLQDLEHKEVLSPFHVHPQHRLTFGMLLYNEAIWEEDEELYGRICNSCWEDVVIGKVPSTALANNLWIGNVPQELAILSLTERVLVARYHPRAQIVKLYPRSRSSYTSGGLSFNSGLRGNVSSYHLNSDEIARMVDGELLPHHPRILAAVIGVSIVGAHHGSDRPLPAMLNVNRERVRDALRFLKANNPFYVDIRLSETNLMLLPEEGVPDELLGVIRETLDTDNLEKEHSGYGAEDDDDYNTDEVERVIDSHEEFDGDEEHDNNAEIPLQSYGVVDVMGTEISERDMFTHAVQNLARTDERYVVRQGGFVNEYPRTDEAGHLQPGTVEDPNYFLGAFPCLFPYGLGGFEVDRPRKLSYAEHAKWAMRYADRRFRLDVQFVFQVFGIMQKRQVAASASLQIRKVDYQRNEEAIRRITTRDLVDAGKEEQERKPISNSAVKALKHHVSTVRAKVRGTDESRREIRSLIWGMTIFKSPPSLWITINPTDIHDPIAQVLTGAEIDLDSFDPTSGPDTTTRLTRIANDPYAASRFFHFIVRVVLSELFGIEGAGQHHGIKRKNGIFGQVEAYIGTVEAQGRGTLHLHVILWLSGAPTASEMKDRLQTDTFRQRVAEFIAVNIRAHHPQLTEKVLSSQPKEKSVSYSRPFDPRNHDLDELNRQEDLLAKLVRAVQIHKCGPGCQKIVRGSITCKRRAPFKLAEEAWIDSKGNWGSKRTIGMMNGWNPTIMLCLRANHDIKLITNGEDTKDLAFYITTYAAKNQQHSSNATALLAKSYAFLPSSTHQNIFQSAQDINKRLIQQCANVLSREQELSAPEVMSYIMGWGDRYISHRFETLHFGSVIASLKKTWPCLDMKKSMLEITGEGDLREQCTAENEKAALHLTSNGLYLQDQMQQYMDRGDDFDDFSFFDFFRNTYDQAITNFEQDRIHKRSHNPIVPYLSDTHHGRHFRVLRKDNHETMVTFSGPWFPRADDVTQHSLYCAAVLALLKPWRTLKDIKDPTISFEEEYALFTQQMNYESKRILENIQYFYECRDKAKEKETVTFFHCEDESPDDKNIEEPSISIDDETKTTKEEKEVTENDIDYALMPKFSAREQLYAEIASNIAVGLKIFDPNLPANTISVYAQKATETDLQKVEHWLSLLTEGENTRGGRYDEDDVEDLGDIFPEKVVLQNESVHLMEEEEPKDNSADETHSTMLNEEQMIAFTILKNFVYGLYPENAKKQVMMLIYGAGGTGKTKIIHMLTDELEKAELSPVLARTATTGVAACIIGGVTLHSWAGLPSRRVPRGDKWVKKPSAVMGDKRKKNILGKRLLGIDEMSLLTADTLASLNLVVSTVRGTEENIDETEPLGGLSTFLTGDFHQFPPVGQVKKALYCKHPPSSLSQTGRQIFEQFDTVVELIDQNRITDALWNAILTRARYGECTSSDLQEIRRLVLTNQSCQVPDFQSSPWDESILITPRNSVRSTWNTHAVTKHCKKTGNILYISPAEDSVNQHPLSMPQRLIAARLNMEENHQTEMKIPLAIGMKVMVTQNVATTANLANGSRATISNITLDEREPPNIMETAINEVKEVKLMYPPRFLILRLESSTNQRMPYLENKEVPLFPVTRKFTIDSNPPCFVTRRQFPLTPAYAFTDFKSQGQTIENVLVDIGKTANFKLTPFNAYVALSRGIERSRIRLLRDFEDYLFTTPPSEELKEEESRLRELARKTKDDYYAGLYGPPHR